MLSPCNSVNEWGLNVPLSLYTGGLYTWFQSRTWQQRFDSRSRTYARQLGYSGNRAPVNTARPCWRVMETGHPSTRAVNSGFSSAFVMLRCNFRTFTQKSCFCVLTISAMQKKKKNWKVCSKYQRRILFSHRMLALPLPLVIWLEEKL